MTQTTVSQRMYLAWNGPKGKFGKHLSIDRDELIDRAFRIWCNMDTHSRIAYVYGVSTANATTRRIQSTYKLPELFASYTPGIQVSQLLRNKSQRSTYSSYCRGSVRTSFVSYTEYSWQRLLDHRYQKALQCT